MQILYGSLFKSKRINCFVFLQEASELSSLKPQLDQLGVPLYAVVKEDVGTEVQTFSKYFKGEIFLDQKVTLCMPNSNVISAGV